MKQEIDEGFRVILYRRKQTDTEIAETEKRRRRRRRRRKKDEVCLSDRSGARYQDNNLIRKKTKPSAVQRDE